VLAAGYNVRVIEMLPGGSALIVREGQKIGYFPIVPGGQIADTPVQPLLQKYFGSLQTQITCLFPVIPHPQEGRIAIVTDVGRGDAMDAATSRDE